jgi:FAD/FMN-containing dehydrogenase
VAADVSLAEFQRALAERGQWLPIDPPGQPTMQAVLDGNLSGPRRYGYGTVREQVLGMRVRLPDGREIKAGGQVVKNVAGYDLCRLFTGAQGRLGQIVEATFKLRPVPEAEQFRQRPCAALAEADQVIERVLNSNLMPVVLDLVAPATVVVGFAGAREAVEWQLDQAGRWGLTASANLQYDRPLAQTISVLPSRLMATLQDLRPTEFVARAGNGSIHYEGGSLPPATRAGAVQVLEQRLQEAFRG